MSVAGVFVLLLVGGCTGAPASEPPTSPPTAIAPPSFAPEPLDAATLTAYDASVPLDLR